MKHSRAHVEETIVERLLRPLPTDRDVPEREYLGVVNRLDVVFKRVLSEVNIPSFTDEDMLSFMHMKAYQMLARNQVDITHPRMHSLFYRAFKNLFYDVLRMQERALKRGLYHDPVDEIIPINLDTEIGVAVQVAIDVFEIRQEEVHQAYNEVEHLIILSG